MWIRTQTIKKKSRTKINGENTRKVQIYITKHPNEKKK
jgi:hypothetical protein